MSLRLIGNQNNVVLSLHNALVVGEYFVLQNSHHELNQVLGGGWIMNLAFNPRALKTQFETYVLKQMHNYLLLWFYSLQGIWETKLVSNHIMVFRNFCCFRISRVVSCNLLSITPNVLFILASVVFFLFFLFLPIPQHNLQEDLLISNKLHNILNTCAFHQEEHLILLFWSNLEILSTI